MWAKELVCDISFWESKEQKKDEREKPDATRFLDNMEIR